MTDQAQAVDDVHSRMMGFLGEEETLVEKEEPEEEEHVEQVEESEETKEETAEEEAEEIEEPTEEITHNGETKVLTKSELKELAQQGFDYTQKTQALAEQRRSYEAQQQAFNVQIAIKTQLSDQVAEIKSLDNQIAQYKQVDWAQLAESDPQQYLKLNHAYRDLKETREAKTQEYQTQANQLTQAQAQSMEQIKQAEAKLLQQKVPELYGPKAAETTEALSRFLSQEGFSDHEIGNILDHRMVSVAWKAAQYDKLKAAKPQVNKRVAEVPKVVKGKQPSNAKADEGKALRDKLRSSGDQNLAAKLIEIML
jgi:chromosome segregation ATPase